MPPGFLFPQSRLAGRMAGMKPETGIKVTIGVIVLAYAGYVLLSSASMLRKMDSWIQVTVGTK